MSQFGCVQAPRARWSRARHQGEINTRGRSRECLFNLSHVLRVVLETVGVDRSPVIHPSCITSAATVANSLTKCPLWQLTPSYVDFFCFGQHDSDTELTCLELWGVSLDCLIPKRLFFFSYECLGRNNMFQNKQNLFVWKVIINLLFCGGYPISLPVMEPHNTQSQYSYLEMCCKLHQSVSKS